jgi:hypothetical protein
MDAPANGLVIHGGTCLALLAFDVGFSIDLDAAEEQVRRRAADSQRESIRHSRRAPPYFEFRPAPLRIGLGPCSLVVGGIQVQAVEAVLFDFGALSVAYALPLSGPLERLLPLARSLSEAPELAADARARVGRLVSELGVAVRRPALAEVAEDYVVFQVTEWSIGSVRAERSGELPAWIAANRAPVARILRAEPGPLSAQEVDDALMHCISYSEADLAFVDWNAALIFDPQPQDASATLEFANVELLEMRHLDDRLDGALDEVYALLERGRVRGSSGALERVSALQVDAAMLFEGVNNALKLLGDQYLARLYRATCQRFHLPDWDQSILRKLGTLDGIYQKLADRRANRRTEALEWIIIALIAFEVGYSLLA